MALTDQNKEKKFSSKQAILILVAANVIALGVFVFLMVTVITKSVRTGEFISQLETKIAEEQRIRSLRANINDTKVDQEKLAYYFITPDKIVDFIEQIESLGKHTKVSLEFDSVNPEGDAQKALAVRFSARGRFEDLFHFLVLLEALPFQISFERAILGHTDTEAALPGVFLWQGTFEMKLLSFIET